MKSVRFSIFLVGRLRVPTTSGIAQAGHVYHTAWDTSDRIPPASVQRAGDNVLAVTMRSHLGGKEEGCLAQAGQEEEPRSR